MFEILLDASALSERLKMSECTVVQFASNNVLVHLDAQLILMAQKYISPELAGVSFYRIASTNNAGLFKEMSIDQTPVFAFYQQAKELSRLICPTLQQIEVEIEDRLSGQQFKKPKLSSLGKLSRSEQSLMEEDKKSNCSETDKSLSAMKEEFVARVLGMSMPGLLSKATKNPNDLITLSNDDLSELYEGVFKAMRKLVGEAGFPSRVVAEAIKQEFVLTAIRKVMQFMKLKFGLTDTEVRWSLDDQFKFSFLGNQKDIKADIVLYGLGKDGEQKRYLTVVECKKKWAGEGIKQALVYMKKLFDLNGDGETIYGFCSNATDFQLLTYNAMDGYKLCDKLEFLYPKMFEDKAAWLADCTPVLRIFYTVLCKQIGCKVRT